MEINEVKRRVEMELQELNEKIGRHNKFLSSEACTKIPSIQKELLVRQLLAMKEYANILTLRIELM